MNNQACFDCDQFNCHARGMGHLGCPKIVQNTLKKESLQKDQFYAAVDAERQRQDNKWGIQRHTWLKWSAILTEECGEVAKAALEEDYGMSTLEEMEKELIQVAAVSKAIWEHLQEIKNKTN